MLPTVKQLGEHEELVVVQCLSCEETGWVRFDELAAGNGEVRCGTCGQKLQVSQDALLQWELLHREARG